jgi:hypothetical protein
MARIDLTKKPQAEQLRILNDYLNRRMQHKAQGEVTISQLVNRFRHNKCFTVRAKTIWLSKLLKEVKMKGRTVPIQER